MIEQTFVEQRESDWKRLERLCDGANVSLRHLTPIELREFVRLYRKVSTDLAKVRTESANLALIEYLNDLVGKSYSILYSAPRKPFLKSIVEALETSADTVRRRKWFIFASATLFFGAGLFVFLLLGARPDLKEALLPGGMEGAFDAWKSGHFQERSSTEGSMMTAFYASNNPRVAMIAGAVGAGTFGFLSIFLVAQNGMIIGLLARELYPLGKVGFLLTSISPHGVPELTGIIISGATGMLLGWTIINPGRRTRGEALKAVGMDAVVLLGTSIVMMFIAAPIEGFFSFNPRIPGWAKITFAVVSFIAWMVFWSSFGKKSEKNSHR